VRLTCINQPLRALGILAVLMGTACGEVNSDTSSYKTPIPNPPQATQVATRGIIQGSQVEQPEDTDEATINCSIDSASKTATCTITKYDYETITWSSNASWLTSGAGTWTFQLDEPTTELLVQLELCDKGECRTIQDSFTLPPELRAAHETKESDAPKPQVTDASTNQVGSIDELPKPQIDCGGNTWFVGEEIECGFDPDNAQHVNWTAVGGSPDYSDSLKGFSTSYDVAGSYTIVLEVCNLTDCATETRELNIISEESTSAEPSEDATETSLAEKLTAVCSFDVSIPKISCQASGYAVESSQLKWESNVSGWSMGSLYEVELVKARQLIPEIIVTLQQCLGSACETVKTLIDTSILVPGKSVQGQGFAELLDVSDGLAGWLSQETVLYAISITDPLLPSTIGVVDVPEVATAAFQDDEYLYAGSRAAFNILPVGDPFGEPIGTFESRFGPSAIMVTGGYAYLTRNDSLLVLDVSDPFEPTEASRLQINGKHPKDIQFHAGHAYIPATLGGLNVVDVTDPRYPSLVNVIPFESHTTGFKIRGSYGYLARIVSVTPTERWYEGSSVFEVLDLSTPAAPVTVGSVTIPTMIHDLDVVGDYAYVTGEQITNQKQAITVVDITSPANPLIVDVPDPNFGTSNPYDIYLHKGHAYIMDSGEGLKVLDLNDPLNPTIVASLELPLQMYCMHGTSEVIYLCAEERYLNIADVSDPDNPVLTSSEIIPSGLASTIVLKDRKAFFSGGGLKIYDLTDPETPKRLPVENYGVDTIAIQGNFMYSTVGEWGLDVWDITDVENQVFVSRTNFLIGMPHDMSHDGRWVVGIANKPYSITLIDVSDPFLPVVTDSYVFDDYADTVTVKDDRVYVPRGSEGVDIFEISSDGILTLVANYQTVTANYVTAFGNRAYVLGGIDILDLTDPSRPALQGRLPSYGIPHRAKVHEGYLYLADGYAGLTLIPLDPPKTTDE